MASPTHTLHRTHSVIDVHTHIYPPRYLALLASRPWPPMVRTTTPSSPSSPPTLILPTYPSSSSTTTRTLTAAHTSIAAKIQFMDAHRIDASVLSLPGPWLDFLPPGPGHDEVAREINDELDKLCNTHPSRLYFFAVLPPLTTTPSVLCESIAHCAGLRWCRGVVMGTLGMRNGLDDPAMLPVWETLAHTTITAAEPEPWPMTVFLHPHYGLPAQAYGPMAAQGEFGDVLELGVGYPAEMALAVARMYLAGVFDAVPALRLLLAHGGGALPALAGRIENCMLHDARLATKLFKDDDTPRVSIWDVLRRHVFVDALVFSAIGLRAVVSAAGGAERVLFGTDHPFFPPLDEDDEASWGRVGVNVRAVAEALGHWPDVEAGVMGANAVQVLGLGRLEW